ncbi:MAG: oxidoreductase [Methylocystaceae bacterium]|nr:oxidoreductase [Methylocystaceae bacterium]
MTNPQFTVKIASREVQADSVVLLDFEDQQGKPLPKFDAGAHIDVHVSDDIIRQYSLSNSPQETSRYRIGVLNDPQSRGGSKSIFENFEEGQIVTISEPRNHFPLNFDASHSILIGGGIGITPMLAMAYALKAEGKSFEIHYCSRTRDKAAFLDELESNFGDVTTLHFDDLGEDQMIKPKTLCENSVNGTHVYVCGPSGFMDWVISESKAAGLASDQVHFEYFNADVETSGTAFEVYAQASDVTVQVAEDQTIIDALLQAGIKVEKSCEQGVCGTCICDVVEGIPDHKDKFLTEDEREDNDQIVTCCSRAKTDRLVLDI